MAGELPEIKGRGSQIRPPNRFGVVQAEFDPEHWADDLESLAELAKLPTRYLPDVSRSIISENDSPDVGFRYSLNPYRGCLHGCAYCYARPSHEYFGLNAGLDFETQIFVKHEAPRLLREFLSNEKWQADIIAISGNTDCYQPAEREFRLTRGCLEVAWEARQPVSIITKNALVCRDLDLLSQMAEHNLVRVNVSLTTLDPELCGAMEPRTSRPAARLRAIRTLTDAGVPVRVLTAPIVPGLTDSEIPALLEAAHDAGAKNAHFILLRLPLTVLPVFTEWIERTQPTRAERVLGLIRQCRDGQLSDSQFGRRMVGTGPIATQIASVFKVFAKKYGLDQEIPPHDRTQFRPFGRGGQLKLF
jgi:DNA repair photolyase